MKDKQMLLEIFDKATKHIDSAPSDNIVDYTSTYVYNLRNQGTLKAKDFETDSISYTSSGFPCSKSYLYLASYIDKAAADMLKKLSN